jgi:hypothetical protein
MKKTLLFVVVLVTSLCAACDGEQEMVTLVGRKRPWGEEGMTDTVNMYNNNGANIASFPVGTKCRVRSGRQVPDHPPGALFDAKWRKVECRGIAGYIVVTDGKVAPFSSQAETEVPVDIEVSATQEVVQMKATLIPTRTVELTTTQTTISSPRMDAFHACLEPCLESGANALSIFPEKQRKIYVHWRFENIPIGAHYVRSWTMDGKEWVRYECAWPGSENGLEENVTLTEPDGLYSGEWVVTISINGVVLLREQIWVEGDWDFWEPAGYFDTCYGKK